MPKGKNILITKQTFERIVIRQHKAGSENLSCPLCGNQGAMLSIEKVGLACGISSREIFRRLDTGQIHFTELPSGLLLVCIASLQAEIQKLKL